MRFQGTNIEGAQYGANPVERKGQDNGKFRIGRTNNFTINIPMQERFRKGGVSWQMRERASNSVRCGKGEADRKNQRGREAPQKTSEGHKRARKRKRYP